MLIWPIVWAKCFIVPSYFRRHTLLAVCLLFFLSTNIYFYPVGSLSLLGGRSLKYIQINTFPITINFLGQGSGHRIWDFETTRFTSSFLFLNNSFVHLEPRIHSSWLLSKLKFSLSYETWFSQLIYFFFLRSFLQVCYKNLGIHDIPPKQVKIKRSKTSLVDGVDSSVVCSLLCLFVCSMSCVQCLSQVDFSYRVEHLHIKVRYFSFNAESSSCNIDTSFIWLT